MLNAEVGTEAMGLGRERDLFRESGNIDACVLKRVI